MTAYVESTAGALIAQHSTSQVHHTHYTSYTNKPWARQYAPIDNLRIRTTVDGDDRVHASFDVLLPQLADDERRYKEPARAPNDRFWRLETEADIEHYWHAEVSDIVLAAWGRYPPIVQTSHTAPLSTTTSPENVDLTYAMYINNRRVPIMIGETKRNLINSRSWQQGLLEEAQKKLSRELRGYADKYQCPQIFCWDGQVLLMLQFRARKAQNIRDADCPVDCWVLPAATSVCTLRTALYNFLAQGFRRCQVDAAPILTVGGLTEYGREFYTGRPIWRVDGQSLVNHPLGYFRIADAETGALFWVHEEDANGGQETAPLW